MWPRKQKNQKYFCSICSQISFITIWLSLHTFEGCFNTELRMPERNIQWLQHSVRCTEDLIQQWHKTVAVWISQIQVFSWPRWKARNQFWYQRKLNLSLWGAVIIADRHWYEILLTSIRFQHFAFGPKSQFLRIVCLRLTQYNNCPCRLGRVNVIQCLSDITD